MVRSGQPKPPRTISAVQDDGQPIRAVFQIFQGLQIRPVAIRVVHPLQNIPRTMKSPVGARFLHLLIQRLDADAISRLAHQLFKIAIALQDSRHAGLPLLKGCLRKITHWPMLSGNSALSIRLWIMLTICDTAVFIGQSDKREELFLGMANRHGLVTGATGTGKILTL